MLEGVLIAKTLLLVELLDLKKYYPVRTGALISRRVGFVKATDGVSFSIANGQTFGLVGESGSGKTTISRMILRVEEPTSGEVRFKGKNIFDMSEMEIREFRRAVNAVFQDPFSSLDPRMRVGDAVAEPVVANRSKNFRGASTSRRGLKDMVGNLLQMVGLKPEHAGLYAHEFSGGQRQRIAIARALAADPELIVLDEPVSSLDVSIRAQIINLLRDLQERYAVAYLLIAHNLATVRHLSHRMGVLYIGKLVEVGESEEIFTHPLHPYTQALIKASLPINPGAGHKAVPLQGEIASPLSPPPGCRLNPRCAKVMPICSEEEPALLEVSAGHHVACHLFR